MPPLVLGGICRFTLHGSIQDRRWANIFDMHIDSVGGGGRDDNVFDQARVMLNEWIDHIAPVTTAAVTLLGCRWVDFDSAGATSGERVDAEGARVMPKPGNVGAAGAAPANVAVLVRKITSSSRANRNGRSYFPGIAEASVEGNLLSTAMLANWNTAADDFLAGINQDTNSSFGGYDSRLSVVHEVAGQATNYSHVTALAPDVRVATQRRRLRG